METISDMLNGPAIISTGTQECALSIDCQEISCATISSGSFFRNTVFDLILLPCLSPPAVKIVFSGGIYYDRIFYRSGEGSLYDFDFLYAHIRVNLDHLRNNSIGLQVNMYSICTLQVLEL